MQNTRLRFLKTCVIELVRAFQKRLSRSRSNNVGVLFDLLVLCADAVGVVDRARGRRRSTLALRAIECAARRKSTSRIIHIRPLSFSIVFVSFLKV